MSVYAIYNKDYDGWWYKDASFTDNIKYARMKSTIADVYKQCCELYEREMFNLEWLVVVEVTEEDKDFHTDFKYPVWEGGHNNMSLLWCQVEPELKTLLLKGLHDDGLQMMYKVSQNWYTKDHLYGTK